MRHLFFENLRVNDADSLQLIDWKYVAGTGSVAYIMLAKSAHFAKRKLMAITCRGFGGSVGGGEGGAGATDAIVIFLLSLYIPQKYESSPRVMERLFE